MNEVDEKASLGGPAPWEPAPLPKKPSLKPPRVHGPPTPGCVTKAGPPMMQGDLNPPRVQGEAVTVRERKSIGGRSSLGERKSAHFCEHHPEGLDECIVDLEHHPEGPNNCIMGGDDADGDAQEAGSASVSGSTNLDLTAVPSVEGYSQPTSLCAGPGQHVSARGSVYGPLGVMDALGLGGRSTMLELLQSTWTLAPASTPEAVVVHR